MTEAEPKSGWNLETVKGKYAAEYDYQGAKFSEGVQEVAWSGKLPDKTHEEFVIDLPDRAPHAQLDVVFSGRAGMRAGVSRWIEIPAEGEHPHEGRWPAPGVKLLPKP